MIKTKFSKHERKYCPAGSKFLNVYQEQINKKTGRKELVKTGETNIYEMIQQELEPTKIENIIHKLAMGDLSVLKQADITYVDATEMPSTLMEFQNIVVKAKQEFDKFPEEVRKEFNNSAEQYVSEMGTDDFYKKMAPYNEKVRKSREEKDQADFTAKVNETVNFNKAVAAGMEVKE